MKLESWRRSEKCGLGSRESTYHSIDQKKIYKLLQCSVEVSRCFVFFWFFQRIFNSNQQHTTFVKAYVERQRNSAAMQVE